MKKSALFFLLFSATLLYAQSPIYKDMMKDMRINFYTVCDSAEAYFDLHGREKGSGYTPFLRWKYENEPKYYPDGNRMETDETMPYREYLRIKSSYPQERLFETGGWDYLGPSTVDSITHHYSAGVGRWEFVLVNPVNPNQIYIGSRSGGLWRTNDEGLTWSHHTDFLPASGVNAISTHPSDFNQVFINVRIATNGTSFGIYKSTDGGITFSQTNFNPASLGFGGLGSNFNINVIKHHPHVPDLVFVGTDRGIFRSEDNLNSWVRINNTWNVTDIEFHPTNNDIIYVYETGASANADRVMKSIDRGFNYIGMANLPGNGGADLNISVPDVCPNCVYAISNNGIYLSTDEGVNFVTRLNPVPAGVGLYFGMPDMLDTSKILGGYFEQYRSTDGGFNFSQCNYWYLGNAAHGPGSMQDRFYNSPVYIHCDMNYMTNVNGTYYACTDGYVSKTTNHGQSWTRLSTTTGNRENYCLGTSQSNHYITICGSQDNGTSIRKQGEWVEFYGADGMEGLVHPLNTNWMIGSTQNGGRIRTRDGGVSLNTIAPPGHVSSWIAPMAYDPNDHMTVYHFGTKVHKTTNFGDSWTDLSTSLTFSTSTIKEAEIAQNNSQIMVITSGSQINLSTNGGLSFSNIQGTLPNYTITDVAFDPLDDSTLVVTYARYQNDGSKVYITHNLGASWTNITHNLGNMPIDCAVIDHTDASNIYLGAKIGVYRKAMNDNVWTLYNDSLANVSIEDMEVCWGSNTIKAASWGRGLWEYSLYNRNTYPAIITTKINSDVTLNTPKETMDQFVTSEIQYSGTLTSVYVKWSFNAPVFNNTIPMQNVGGNIWRSATTLPTSPAGNKIYFKVYAVGNNGDTTETYKFMYTLHPFQYCNGIGSTASGNLYIRRFQLAGVDNFNNVNSVYIHYTTPTLILWRDSTYTLNMEANTNWTDNDYSTYIDYNRDAEFSTPSERVVYDMNSGSAGSGQFTVPHTAVTDDTLRLRARLGYWGSTYDPCIETLGEVEDYHVVIRSVPELNYAGNTSYCSSDTVILLYTGEPVDSLIWEITDGAATYTYSGGSVTSAFPSGSYQVVLKGYKYGMEFSEPLAGGFTVSNVLNVQIISDLSLCLGDSILLQASGAGAYLWGQGLGTQPNVWVSPVTDTQYTLTGTSGLCSGADTVDLTVHPLPQISFAVSQDTLCIQSGSITLQASPGGGSFSGPGVTGNNFDPQSAGLGVHTLSYSYTSVDLCTNSATTILTVLACSSLNEEQADIRVYPNPSHDLVYIQFPTSLYEVCLYDELGRLLVQQNNSPWLDIRSFAAGVYWLKLSGGEQKYVTKIIKY